MYVITGATGNTGKKIVEHLLKAGKAVKALGRDAHKLQALAEQGAELGIGDLENADFLSEQFVGAQAVYALIPPKWDLQEPWRNYQRRVGAAISTALERSAVKHVVVLSSNGAQMPEGAGPVSGLYEFEQMLQKIQGLNILSLRAGFFMQNFFAQIPMVKQAGIIGYSMKADVKTPIVHTDDIAAVAVKHLLSLDFTGMQKVFVPGQRDLTMQEVAEVLGKAIGKPELPYVAFSPADAKAGMMQSGIPETIADGYNELFEALSSGKYLSDYQRTPENTTPTSIEDFAKEFAAAYQHA